MAAHFTLSLLVLLATSRTVADICCGYALILAERVGLDEGVPEGLRAYRDQLKQRDGFQRAWAREAEGPSAV